MSCSLNPRPVPQAPVCALNPNLAQHPNLCSEHCRIWVSQGHQHAAGEREHPGRAVPCFGGLAVPHHAEDDLYRWAGRVRRGEGGGEGEGG